MKTATHAGSVNCSISRNTYPCPQVRLC